MSCLGSQTLYPQTSRIPPPFLELLLLATSYRMEYPFGQFGSTESPPNSLPTPSLQTREAEKASQLCKYCSAITKTLVCYQCCKSKAQHHSGCYEICRFHPSQTQCTSSPSEEELLLLFFWSPAAGSVLGEHYLGQPLPVASAWPPNSVPHLPFTHIYSERSLMWWQGSELPSSLGFALKITAQLRVYFCCTLCHSSLSGIIVPHALPHSPIVKMLGIQSWNYGKGGVHASGTKVSKG